MAMAAGRIGIETVVWSRGDDYAVAVNIDVARSRPRPGEVHRVFSVDFVAARSERDLPRRRRSRGCNGRGGGYGRCRCRCRCRRWSR